MGQAAVFLRLANCNLTCSWCDTRYSWDWAQFDPADERHEIEVAALAELIVTELQGAMLLILTGGEPMLQQPALTELLQLVRQRVPDLRAEIETNGTISPVPPFAEQIDLFVVSPKLTNSAVSEKRRVRPRALASFPADRTVLKFVVTEAHDLEEVAELRTVADIPPHRTWIMPEGVTCDAILRGLRALSAPVARLGYNVSPRLHILLWGEVRGT